MKKRTITAAEYDMAGNLSRTVKTTYVDELVVEHIETRYAYDTAGNLAHEDVTEVTGNDLQV